MHLTAEIPHEISLHFRADRDIRIKQIRHFPAELAAVRIVLRIGEQSVRLPVLAGDLECKEGRLANPRTARKENTAEPQEMPQGWSGC